MNTMQSIYLSYDPDKGYSIRNILRLNEGVVNLTEGDMKLMINTLGIFSRARFITADQIITELQCSPFKQIIFQMPFDNYKSIIVHESDLR
jgi:hypothetical protein